MNLQTKATSGYYSWLPPFFVCLNFDAHLPSCRTIPNWSVNRGLRVNFTCCQHQHLRGILKPNPISVATIDIPQNTIIQFWFIGQKNHFSNPHFEKSMSYSSFAIRQLNQINISKVKTQTECWARFQLRDGCMAFLGRLYLSKSAGKFQPIKFEFSISDELTLFWETMVRSSLNKI